jgi:hypothetical protein
MTDWRTFPVLVLFQGHFSVRPDSPSHQLTKHGFRHQPESFLKFSFYLFLRKILAGMAKKFGTG